MSLSSISIRRPVFAWMLMLAIMLFGAISFKNIGVSEMPDVDIPMVTIQLTYRGAAPNIMESEIVDLVEEAMLSVEGIETISSSSKQETASVVVEFNIHQDIDLAMQEIQNKIAQVRSRLPETMDPPVVKKNNPEDNPIMWISLSADQPLREIINFARNNIKDKIQSIPGVSEIWLSGYVEPTLRIWLDPQKLNQLELSVKDITNAINKEHQEMPAGRLETDTKEYNLRYLGEALQVEDFENILITERGGQKINIPIYLKDVAKIELGLDDIRRLSRTNGKMAIGLGIKKQRGYNSVAIGNAVKLKIEELTPILPQGYTLQVNFDTTEFIKDSIHEMNFELVLASLLTALVCLLFLASIKSTFNILLAIPTSIIGSFLFIYFLGYTLNNFTLLALTLVIGIVVDDAILVLENIVRHQEMGKSTIQAAIDGTQEITGATVATSLALIAIFIPVIFMKGIMGKFFLQFGMVLSIAVALSLLEALTFTSMRCSRMQLIQHHEKGYAHLISSITSKLAKIYQQSLYFALRYKWIVILLCLVIFIGSLLLIPSIKKEFAPQQDQSGFLIMAQSPIGSSIHYTDQHVQQIEKILSTMPEVKRYFLAVGGFGGGEVDKAMIFVSLKKPHDRPIHPAKNKILSQMEIMDLLREQFKGLNGIRTIIQDMSTRGITSGRGFPIEFSIRGPDWNTLTGLSKKLIDAMKSSTSMREIDSDYREGQKEFHFIPLRLEAANRGVSIEDIGMVISALMGGVRNGKFTEGSKRNDIIIRLDANDRQTAEAVKTLKVRNNKGELIPLAELIIIEEKDVLQSITRKDRERAINITANIAENKSQQEALTELNQLAKQLLPDRYRIVAGGSTKTYQESFQSLLFALILGFVVAYMILASQYNSLIHPFIIMLALPFSITGAFLALKLTHNSLNLYSYLGIILLMGISKKNSIVLVEFFNQLRTQGMGVREAILQAAPLRLRPILMTSLTIIAAALPSALGLGTGSEVRMPMSIVIIGGMLISTLLTLYFIPCVYLIMSRLERGKKFF